VGAENIHHEYCPVGIAETNSPRMTVFDPAARMAQVEKSVREICAARIAELEKTVRALCDARPEVIAFALAMERKLEARDARGYRGWIGMPYTYLLQQMRHKVFELQNQVDMLELESQLATPQSVLDEAADVANLAMMVADNAGALGLRSESDGHAL
jgi:hypothetical protein